MFALAIFVPWSYTIISYLDYCNNKEAYQKCNYFPKAWDSLILNVFVWFPLSILLLTFYFPIYSYIDPFIKEIGTMTFEVVFGEIWFYSFHRLCHTSYLFFIHKTHHEVREPIGMLALYAHPIEAIFVNSGSMYLTHMIFRHSLFHMIVSIVAGFINTILHSHSPETKKEHYLHHKYRNVEFGWSLFMDRLFGTKHIKY